MRCWVQQVPSKYAQWRPGYANLQLLCGWLDSCADYYTLLRFLRARNYELDKAMKMWLDTIEWRKEYEVDTILDSFVFHEREQFLMAYPQGYHKTDKLVGTS